MDQIQSSHKNQLSLAQIVERGVKLTPMMEQYFEIRQQYPETLLMFRMGDFYELFFEDARNASKLLNISLTHRGKLGDYPIPMAGIPHHAASTYIDRITTLGMKVAICEQIEDPKEAKGIVKRAVTQVVSPGMPYDLDKSEKTENSFMSCAYEKDGQFFLIFVDFTTGDFFGFEMNDMNELCEKIQIFRPKEFITYLGQWDKEKDFEDFLSKNNILKTHLSQDYFDEKYTSLYIKKIIPTYERDEVLKLNPAIIAPIGAISYYISSTQSVEELKHFRPFKLINNQKDMKITYPTLVGLEILPKTREYYNSSILGFMDSTRTSMGTRKLKTIFQSPLRDLKLIHERQTLVEYFLAEESLHEDLRDSLYDIRDIERILAKVTTGKVNGGDLLNLSQAITSYFGYFDILKKIPKDIFPKFSKKEMEELLLLSEKIKETINDELGANLDKGNLIKSGCNKNRDRLFKLTQNASDSLLELEAKYRKETGISNLKVKYNNVAGYFIEVSKSQTNKVPKDFVRRQTLVNSERYQTDELADFEKEILSAKDKLQKLEKEIFDGLVKNVSLLGNKVLDVSEGLSLLDVFQSLAWTAKQEDFVKPEIDENKQILDIKQSWHPLIKSAIKDQFVCHDLKLDEKTFFGLITGPNMAGKTTVMREAAIIQFLAQIGSFVPAKSAHIGLTDYIFSRLGAHDDIIKGQSTFMVEMSETAEILRHATSDSLIILDEIGRGTSTYDGLSIAWSLVEFFVKEIKAITLFSTHYHELIDLVESLPHAKNLTVKTINENGNVQFLYQLIEEGAGQSFGIHVAKLAGLPKVILNRSEEILLKLEKNHNHSNDLIATTTSQKKKADQLDLFQGPTVIYREMEHPMIKELSTLDVLNMTPLQAIAKLQELKEKSAQ